ncbi:MAG: hypothetical protein V1685_06600 [Parcubacteria group bacterium]
MPDSPVFSKEEILKPADDDREIHKPKKKRHRFRTFLIVLVGAIIIIVIVVGATGAWNVPGVSAIFGMNKPKDLGVKTSTEALTSLKKKIPLKITGESVNYSTASPNEIFSGKISVDERTTSEEITSWLNRHNGTNPPVTALQVSFIEGGMEISGMVNQYIHAPVYVQVMVEKTGEKSIGLDLQKAKVGLFSIPESYYDQVEQWFENAINDRMATVPNFSMDIVEYHDGFSYFKGTYPENIKPTNQGWSGLVDY